MQKKIITILAVSLFSTAIIAQDVDIFKLMDEESKQNDKNRTDYTIATFKTTRLINGHTIETIGKGILDFKVSHRFGMVNSGGYELFGLDNATMRMSFDYGLSNRLMAGIGRSTFEKQYDAFAKYKLLRQATGKHAFPFTVTAVGSVMVKTLKDADPTIKRNFSDRLFYAYQLLIGRKLSEKTSFQIAPSVVHHNIVPQATDPNDNIAIGIGGRHKISKRISINAEYYYVLPAYKLPNTHNSLSVGVDIETGGHVFQLHFTNSRGMTERTFIAETPGQWSNGDVFFGFNISRVFTIGKKKKTA